MATKKLSLKLLINKNTKKVVFAEAGKDFVDFLFSLLTLPVGSIVKLLTQKSMVGCIGELYESVENLENTYMQQSSNKSGLLQPNISSISCPNMLLLENGDTTQQTYYASNNTSRCRHITRGQGTNCPCGYPMIQEVAIIDPISATAIASGAGYVMGVVTYMVTDDLKVTPMSTISSVALLNSLNVKEVGALEEKVVDVGFEEGIAVLRASLKSKSVFTDVFVRNLV